jgi:sugar phosphate isomerase/epimerase
VRIVTDSVGDQPSPEEVVTRLRAFVPEFQRAGVKLALENHDRFKAAALAWIIEQVGLEHAGICLDTVNSFGALEGPEVVVRTLAPYTLNLHVKDFAVQRVDSQMGFIVTGSPAGRGAAGSALVTPATARRRTRRECHSGDLAAFRTDLGRNHRPRTFLGGNQRTLPSSLTHS